MEFRWIFWCVACDEINVIQKLGVIFNGSFCKMSHKLVSHFICLFVLFLFHDFSFTFYDIVNFYLRLWVRAYLFWIEINPKIKISKWICNFAIKCYFSITKNFHHPQKRWFMLLHVAIGIYFGIDRLNHLNQLAAVLCWVDSTYYVEFIQSFRDIQPA